MTTSYRLPLRPLYAAISVSAWTLCISWNIGCQEQQTSDPQDAAMTDTGPIDMASMQEDQGTDIKPDTPMWDGLRVFVSSRLLSGDSIPNSDDLCQTLALEAELGGQWASWISTPTQDALDKINGEGPWHLVDGTVAFATKQALTQGPEVPLDMDETGTLVSASEIYTGTGPQGRATGEDCRQWRSYYAADQGTVGSTVLQDDGWTQAQEVTCDKPRRVYCFEISP